MTIDLAYASFSKGELGSLEPGKLADYVVISRDIVIAAVDGVLDARVLAIVVDGQLVFGNVCTRVYLWILLYKCQGSKEGMRIVKCIMVAI